MSNEFLHPIIDRRSCSNVVTTNFDSQDSVKSNNFSSGMPFKSDSCDGRNKWWCFRSMEIS
ncbi:MAG: hypothetical protein QXO75_09595, partial [Nitrososphaerota archaeon]